MDYVFVLLIFLGGRRGLYWVRGCRRDIDFVGGSGLIRVATKV